MNSKTIEVSHDKKLNKANHNVSMENSKSSVGKKKAHLRRSSPDNSSSSHSSVQLSSPSRVSGSLSSAAASNSVTDGNTAITSGSKTASSAPNGSFSSDSLSPATVRHRKNKNNPRDQFSSGHPSETKSSPPPPLPGFFARYSVVVSCIYSLVIFLAKLALVLFSVLLFSFCVKVVCCFSFSFVPLVSSVLKVFYESRKASAGNESGDGSLLLGVVPWSRLVEEINRWWEEVYRCQQTY